MATGKLKSSAGDLGIAVEDAQLDKVRAATSIALPIRVTLVGAGTIDAAVAYDALEFNGESFAIVGRASEQSADKRTATFAAKPA